MLHLHNSELTVNASYVILPALHVQSALTTAQVAKMVNNSRLSTQLEHVEPLLIVQFKIVDNVLLWMPKIIPFVLDVSQGTSASKDNVIHAYSPVLLATLMDLTTGPMLHNSLIELSGRPSILLQTLLLLQDRYLNSCRVLTGST